MMSSLCVYHRADYDGLMSAAIITMYAAERGMSIKLEGWDFGDPTPSLNSLDSDWKFVVDLPHDVCPRWVGQRGFVWIDHHESSIERAASARPLEDIAPGGHRVQVGLAACQLAHRFCFADPEPKIVQMLGAYDVWDLGDPDVVSLQYGLRATRRGRNNEEEIERLMHFGAGQVDIDELVKTGRDVEAWHLQTCNEVVQDRSYRTQNGGVRFLTLASAHARGLRWFGDLSQFEMESYDALLCWSTNGKRAWVSMYHADHARHLDLSALARSYGGGGHRGACGCEMSLEEFFCRFPVVS